MRADDRFSPGKWRVEGWSETGGISTRGSAGEIKPQIIDLTPEQAAQHPGAVFFTYFYSGVPKDAEISFRDGKVDGTFHQKSVDDIAAHDVKIRGTYSRSNFHVTFVYRAFGTDLEQQVEGELIDPAREKG
jgi:hypothetical protein